MKYNNYFTHIIDNTKAMCSCGQFSKKDNNSRTSICNENKYNISLPQNMILP